MGVRWVAVVIVVSLVACACAAEAPASLAERVPEAPPRPPDTQAGNDLATVESVVDGDTIHVSGVGTVRLIGVDTPETRHPDRGQECFGAEATVRMSELLPAGESVRLAYDQDRRDRFDRVLAYVYRGADELFINADLVRTGHARATDYPPNSAFKGEFSRLEAQARSTGEGLWSACPQPTPTPQPTSVSTSTSTSTTCDVAYPDVCLPPPPPDLSCSDTPSRSFRALPADPHELDGNSDGVACEL
jgi:micrococcal nuclease